MPSIGLWCAVAETEYSLLTHTLPALLDHESVREALILHTGSRRPSTFGFLANACHKIHEVHRCFGTGYIRSLQDGGYDQVSARNYALEIMESGGSDWLWQIDADDYYDPGLASIVAKLDERYDAVCCSCYTLISPTQYWYNASLETDIGGKRLINPHTRIWRSALRKRFEHSPRVALESVNITRHCGVDFSTHPYWRLMAIEGPFHFHLHCLLGKEHTAARTVGRDLAAPLSRPLRRCLRGLKFDC
jgi:hypothetical protein